MSQSITAEAFFALKCIGMRAVITAAYDLLRICRNCLRHSHFAVSIEDFFFWVICAIFIFFVLHRENNGILRWYCVGGALVGMAVYGKLISPYFVYIMSTICKKTIYLVVTGIRYIFRPIRWFFCRVFGWIKKLCKFFTKRKETENK